MKILLVRPHSVVSTSPVPLGLGYVAEAIRRARPSDRITLLDARVRGLSAAQVGERIRELHPDVVGITAFSIDARDAHEVATLTRLHAPDARVIMGGPYPTSHGEVVLRDRNVDAIVIGEGEATVVELLDVLDGGGDLAEVEGIVYRDRSGEVVATAPRPLIKEIDELVPAWDLYELPMYFKRFGRSSWNRVRRDHRGTMIMTSRGCPYNCIFCHHSFGKKYRARSPERVVEEIVELRSRYDVREVEIVDDCFNLRNDRAKAILGELVDRRLGMHLALSNGIRGDLVDDEMLDLFREAGVFRTAFAVESANARVQKLIKKKIDLQEVKRAIAHTAERGILTMGYFIMGFPTETYEEMIETADFANESDLHLALFFYLNPFPGTEVAELAGMDTSDIAFRDYQTMVVNLSEATDEQLHKANKYAFQRFYSNPRRIARTLRLLPWGLTTLAGMTKAVELCYRDSVT